MNPPLLNLLPPLHKDRLRYARATRVLIRVAAALVFAFAVFDVLLLNTVVVLKMALVSADEVLASTKLRAQEERAAAVEEEIRHAEAAIANVQQALAGTGTLTEDLAYLEKFFPGDVYLTSLSFDPGTRHVSAIGFAPMRSLVLDIEERLKGDGRVRDLVFPYTNYTKDADIIFTTEFTLTP